MAEERVTIRKATVVQTGIDGGHSYLRGECDYAGEVVSVTALMADKDEEADLSDGTHAVSYESSDFTRGAGLLLSNCCLVKNA